MKIWFGFLGLLLLLASACTDDTPQLKQGTLQPVTAKDLQIVTGQIVYVPAYSEVYISSASEPFSLSVTLAIHNTDLNHEIIIQSVRYYDTDGKLIRNYIESPVAISPLATTGFVIPESDRSGGWGANFIVEWVAEDPVYEPVIEAVMISTRSANGVSMISTGRVISQISSNE